MHLNNILTKGVWLDLPTSKKKDYNPLDYFRMGIIDEISFFFFDVENTAHFQKLLAGMMQKLKDKMYVKKRLKFT